MKMDLGYTRLIIEECRKADLLRNQCAYVLATAFHETAHTMKPIREMGGEKYLKSKPYYPYVGMGFVQLTWKRNYEKAGKALGVDFVSDPKKLLEPAYSAAILVAGMKDGWFTTKALDDYITLYKSDYAGARRIVNGTDKAAIASRLIAAGTHNVTAVLSGNNGSSPRNFCGCWLLTDYISATPVFAQYSYASSAALVSVTQDIPKYAAAFYQVNETDSLPTFTSAAIDTVVDAGSPRCYWASRRVKTPEPGHVETATYGGSGTHLLFNAAIWA